MDDDTRDDDTRDALEAQFHALVRHRAGHLIDQHAVPLPRLADMPTDPPTAWFPVPGMYGGFAYRYDTDRRDTLVVESWWRVVGGSGQRHAVTKDGFMLVADQIDL